MVVFADDPSHRVASTDSNCSTDSASGASASSSSSQGSVIRIKRSFTTPSNLGGDRIKGWVTGIVQNIKSSDSPASSDCGDDKDDANRLTSSSKNLASLIRRVGSAGSNSEPSSWIRQKGFSSTVSKMINSHRRGNEELETVMQKMSFNEKRHIRLLALAGFPHFEDIYAESRNATDALSFAKKDGLLKIRVAGVLGKAWSQYFCVLDDCERLHVYVSKDAEYSIGVLAVGDCVVMKQKDTRKTVFTLHNRQNNSVIEFDANDAQLRKEWISALRLASYRPRKLIPRELSSSSPRSANASEPDLSWARTTWSPVEVFKN